MTTYTFVICRATTVTLLRLPNPLPRLPLPPLLLPLPLSKNALLVPTTTTTGGLKLPARSTLMLPLLEKVKLPRKIVVSFLSQLRIHTGIGMVLGVREAIREGVKSEERGELIEKRRIYKPEDSTPKLIQKLAFILSSPFPPTPRLHLKSTLSPPTIKHETAKNFARSGGRGGRGPRGPGANPRGNAGTYQGGNRPRRENGGGRPFDRQSQTGRV